MSNTLKNYISERVLCQTLNTAAYQLTYNINEKTSLHTCYHVYNLWVSKKNVLQSARHAFRQLWYIPDNHNEIH